MDADIKAVLFDFGGVLSLPPVDSHMEKLRRLCGLDRVVFEREYRTQRGDYDRGAIDGSQYWSRVMRAGGKAPTAHLVRSLVEEDTAAQTRINDSVLAWALELKEAGMRTGILSNMPRDILAKIEDRFGWVDRIEVRIFSCDLGVTKPEAQIYRTCLDALGLEGANVLFLDDSPQNVDGAVRAGIRAVLFSGFSEALREIVQRGWLPAGSISVRERT